jgi:murein DD-endopeptidase MepM/ murein hydrolase activator NlpD
MLRLLAFISLACLAMQPVALGIELQLPTENRHLFSQAPEKFYMYVDRYFDGKHTQPWQAGSYGFVRTSLRIGESIVETKFHEGIDIAPIKRDKAGNPLDLVNAIADGKVAYVSARTGASNYGKYIVVEHQWENSAVYSIYAHLADITCQAGDAVTKGAVLGRMGYTGAGITRTRAHLHLELALMLSSHYVEYSAKQTNLHGLFNGMNLAGLDVAAFFLAQKENPSLTLSQFFAAYPVYYKVTIPNNGPVEMANRYPWMVRGISDTPSASWEIAFSETGMPLSFTASDRQVSQPQITMVRSSDIPHKYRTRGLISGEGKEASIARDGTTLLNLLTGNFPITAAPPATPEP